jgi:hypothetical protein
MLFAAGAAPALNTLSIRRLRLDPQSGHFRGESSDIVRTSTSNGFLHARHSNS